MKSANCKACGVSGSRDADGIFVAPCASCKGERFHEADCPAQQALVAGDVVALRDAPIPTHDCFAHVDETGHCTACGTKIRTRPLREIQRRRAR